MALRHAEHPIGGDDRAKTCNVQCWTGIQASFSVRLQNGLPFKVVEIDVSKLDEQNPDWCYTEEQVQQRYGPDEGREFGNQVQICGARIPKSRALKFVRSGAASAVLQCTWRCTCGPDVNMLHSFTAGESWVTSCALHAARWHARSAEAERRGSGPKVADAFNKVSYEEKHALMMGMAQFPEAFVQESLREKFQGSNGTTCDACGTPVKGVTRRAVFALENACGELMHGRARVLLDTRLAVMHVTVGGAGVAMLKCCIVGNRAAWLVQSACASMRWAGTLHEPCSAIANNAAACPFGAE